MSFKNVVFVKVITFLLISRPFGYIIIYLYVYRSILTFHSPFENCEKKTTPGILSVVFILFFMATVNFYFA